MRSVSRLKTWMAAFQARKMLRLGFTLSVTETWSQAECPAFGIVQDL
jgi:hypothetical protein